MSKSVSSTVLDTALNYLKNNGDDLVLCDGQPTTLSHCSNNKGTGDGKRLGHIAVDSSDYTVGAGDGGGSSRKAAVAAQDNIAVDVSGTFDHVAIIDAGTALLLVTTVTGQSVTAGNAVDLATWDYEISSPT